jgi:hypothetical protein
MSLPATASAVASAFMMDIPQNREGMHYEE